MRANQIWCCRLYLSYLLWVMTFRFVRTRRMWNQAYFKLVSVKVLALGEPASSFFLGGAAGVPALSLADVGVNFTVLDGSPEARAQLLPPSDVGTVVAFYSNPTPAVVVVGMVYAMQGQLAVAFRATGARAVGLDDGFALWANDTLPARFVAPVPLVDEVFVAAKRWAHRRRPTAVLSQRPTRHFHPL